MAHDYGILDLLTLLKEHGAVRFSLKIYDKNDNEMTSYNRWIDAQAERSFLQNLIKDFLEPRKGEVKDAV
jgi:hypothetical protein